jgi:Sec-independent protein translocase protein TatA
VFAFLPGREIVIIVVIALLVLGGSQLPKLISSLSERREEPEGTGEAPQSDPAPDGEPGRGTQ